MAKWFHFEQNYDHVWPSRAHTAFAAGQKVYVKDEVAEKAAALGRGKIIDKPAESDPGYLPTTNNVEHSVDETATAKAGKAKTAATADAKGGAAK